MVPGNVFSSIRKSVGVRNREDDLVIDWTVGLCIFLSFQMRRYEGKRKRGDSGWE